MKTLEELQAIRDKMKAKINNRGIAGSNDYRIVVGMATCGIAAGARNTLNAITEEIEAKHITNAVVSQTGCIGICKYEPIVEVFAPGAEKVWRENNFLKNFLRKKETGLPVSLSGFSRSAARRWD